MPNKYETNAYYECYLVSILALEHRAEIFLTFAFPSEEVNISETETLLWFLLHVVFLNVHVCLLILT
jgi:hypothetical protein